MKKFYTFLFLSLFLVAGLSAQTVEKQVLTPDGRPALVRFGSRNTLKADNPLPLLGQLLKADKNTAFKPVASPNNRLGKFLMNRYMPQAARPTDEQGFRHDKFQQFFKGIPVEYGVYTLHSKNSNLTAISGEYYPVADRTATTPALSEKQALQYALQKTAARRYQWEAAAEEKWLKKEQQNAAATFYPQAELVIFPVFQTDNQAPLMRLAYKFDIYAAEPLSREWMYVDAENGKILYQDPIIKHADGPADTRYAGSRTISTEQNGAAFRLRDASRGQGIETYNMQRSLSYGAAVPFTDADNNWTAAEWKNTNKDDAALDAHWGAMMTYDYWKTVHNRNSFDNANGIIKSYVHYSIGYDNAFWDGSVMTYGDGDKRFDALTSLDVVAHEIGHAVCQYTANLAYKNESGAINEALSDIWGACVEYYAAPGKQTWLIGEDIDKQRPSLRSMSNPKAENQPDTYKGINWYTGSGDNGGVHQNSGVMNFCFYMLTVGKTGTNDQGFAYNVTGIGMEKAAKIVYRAESQYLTSNSRYINARNSMIQAATDLYGATSNEVMQVGNAWDAVGVYDLPSPPSNLVATAASGTSVNLTWTDNSNNETGFVIERSVNSRGNFVPVGTVGANVTTFSQTGLTTHNIYYYRVQAQAVNLNLEYSNIAGATLGNPPFIIIDNGNTATCDNTFLDPGGFDNYPDNTYLSQTLSPLIPGKRLKVDFKSLSLGAGDGLLVFDGANSTAPFIGLYLKTAKLPPPIYATNPEGKLTFIFYSDGLETAGGWEATTSCVEAPNAPTNLTATATSAGSAKLNWEDNSDNETGFQIERYDFDYNLYSSGPYRFPLPPPNIIGTVPANVNTFTDNVTDGTYYYRVRAVSTGYSAYSNLVSLTLGIPRIVMSSGIRLEGGISTCQAIYLDPRQGAYDGPFALLFYQNLSPVTQGAKLRVAFNTFNIGPNDYLKIYDGIYDGARLQAPLLGSYSGSTLPPTLTATNAEGKLTFVYYSAAKVPGYNWEAMLSCVSTKPQASVTLSNLTQTYDGMPKNATVTTVPAGLPVIVKYNGSILVPAGAGSYTVEVLVNSPDYQGSAAGTLLVNKAGATISLSQLTQVYDGSPKPVGVVTVPADIARVVTYNNLSNPPVYPGLYEVKAMLVGNYTGSVTGTLAIGKAGQTINFPAINPRTLGDTAFMLPVTATSGLPVSLAVTAGSAALSGNVLTLTGAGAVKLTASQAGDGNFNPASMVEQNFCVNPVKPVIAGSSDKALPVFTLSSPLSGGNQWLLDGKPVAGAIGQQFFVRQAGTYSLQVSVDGCSNVSEPLLITAGELPENTVFLSLSPNPAQEEVSLNYWTDFSAGSVWVEVYNSLGIKVHTQTLSLQNGTWTATVKIDSYRAGNYFFRVQDGKNTLSRKLIKQ
jgi:Zn-dependent metalloprotease